MDSIAAQLNGKNNEAPAENPANNILEFNQLRDFLSSSFLALQQKAEAERKLFTLAAQVAHDIRSPLAALQIVVNMSANTIPEEQRVILRGAAERINDIANNLLHDYKQSRKTTEKNQHKNKLSPELIASVVDKIITEKRTQYINKNITFDFLADGGTRGLFALVNLAHFNRALSNLLNNAVEAIKHENGKIIIKIKKNNNLVKLEITDNGCGMPKEMISQIGNSGFTSGKKDGAGIGLFTAAEQIKQWNGTLNVESEVNKGTTIAISLPTATHPPWFKPELAFSPDSKIIIVDDEEPIHQLWTARFNANKDTRTLPLLHFYDPDEFENHLMSNRNTNDFYLVDYEFINRDKNGIDLLTSLDITKQSMIVSSRYEDEPVRQRCMQNNISIIPKNFVPYIPIVVNL